MYLRLNVIDSNQEKRQFIFQFENLEIGFDIVNRIKKQGDILISADLIDDYQRTSLPVEAFDGVSFLAELKQLELEWISILAKSFPIRLRLDLEATHWYRKKLSFYEQSIVRLELMISDVNSRCEHQEIPFRTKSEVVFNRYQSIVRRYEAQLKQAHWIRKLILDRLQ
ncbi:hypothetical protein [Spirosoma validum]|uniref:Uncharacterized protein n=1 Tax=Spirosoma validum TaxID=2771355 RepID=A0A927GF17_9BACT|nr:hypothetical protein [Spirosoma validum]MBD2755258.1 hypothetical protein [Spirosoma validum]